MHDHRPQWHGGELAGRAVVQAGSGVFWGCLSHSGGVLCQTPQMHGGQQQGRRRDLPALEKASSGCYSNSHSGALDPKSFAASDPDLRACGFKFDGDRYLVPSNDELCSRIRDCRYELRAAGAFISSPTAPPADPPIVGPNVIAKPKALAPSLQLTQELMAKDRAFPLRQSFAGQRGRPAPGRGRRAAAADGIHEQELRRRRGHVVRGPGFSLDRPR